MGMLQRGPAMAVATLACLAGSTHAQIGGLVKRELAGNDLAQFPFFEYVKAINEGAAVRLGIDPGTNPGLVGNTLDVYITAHKNIAGWTASPALVDVSGGAETMTPVAGTIQANTIVVDAGTLSGNAGIELGVGYDLVLDVDQDGVLDSGDYIDGFSDTEAGFYVCRDTAAPGPLATVELTYDLSAASFDAQNTFYPATIGTMGKLPLVVMSHGNGHNYQWYDHLGTHLASYGYVFMSHENNTGPGVEFAATTTLSNTDAFINNLATIGGGVMNGHVDTDRIIFMGHSRGGEGVVIAYDRIFDGVFVPLNYQLGDLKLVSSIAPVDFMMLPITDPHSVNYHLWVGEADSDVHGCASSNAGQPFHLHDRAQEYRQAISLFGVGHGDFHNGGGSSVAFGPCLVGRPDTHKIMKGYLFPLVERYIDGNIPAKDFLSRQWESFHPPGAPVTNPCVTVDLMYRDGSAPGKIVIDDFQKNPAATTSSLGLPVAFTVSTLTEGEMDDNDLVFTDLASDPMNGMTLSGDGLDDSRGVVFEWNGGAPYYAYVVPGGGPLNLWKYISFRAAQSTRDAYTIAVLADLSFDVTVVDTSLNFARISVTAHGGGIEEPYQRTGCGIGVGWNNEFETIRVPIEAFRFNNTAINLSSILAVGFEFGPAHGSNEGRIGLDDVELLLD